MRRVIIVGVGGMGNAWTRVVAAAKDWEAVAYVDTNAENLATAAERYGMPAGRCYAKLEQALREAEADALIDVTPQKARKATCLAALRKGLHVLSEKPLSDTVKSAKAIVTAAEKAGRTFMVAQNYRFQPVTRTAEKAVAAGRIGQPGYAEVRFHKGPRFGGFREEMPYVLVLDMSIHHFDMMRCILGADIATVQAVSINAPWNWNKGDATVMAQLEMSNGVTVNYSGSWVARGWETGWNADWRIDGSEGCLLWEADELYLSAKPGSRRKLPLLKMKRIHQEAVLDAFGRAMDRNEEPETSGRRNLNSLAATHAVVRAARTRSRVAVADVLA